MKGKSGEEVEAELKASGMNDEQVKLIKPHKVSGVVSIVHLKIFENVSKNGRKEFICVCLLLNLFFLLDQWTIL